MRISAFLVEDKPDIRKALIDAMEEIAPLRFIGHADDEMGAREWLSANEQRWNLAIVDLFLAEGSGFGVIRECQGRHPDQKVVVLTSYTQPNILERCHALGADGVFDKSTELEKLVHFCLEHAAHLTGKLPLTVAAHAPAPGPAAMAPPAPQDGSSTPLFTHNSRPIGLG